MKKRNLVVMIVAAGAMSIGMTGCGYKEANAPKQAVEETEDETEEEVEEESEAEQTEEETKEGTIDYMEPGIQIEGIDPYEEELFELFGLDENVPRLAEGDTVEFVYETAEDIMTKGVEKRLYMHGTIPVDYMNEVMDYAYRLHPDGIKLTGKYRLDSPIEKERLAAKPSVVFRLENGSYGKVTFSSGLIAFYSVPSVHKTDVMSVYQRGSGEGSASIYLRGTFGDEIILSYRYEDWPDMPLIDDVADGDRFEIEYDYAPSLFEGSMLPYLVYSFDKQ